MGKAAWRITTVLLVAIAAYLLYQNAEQRRQQERVLAEVRTQAEASRARLEQLASEQEKLRQTLSESQDTLAGANDKASLLMREDLFVIRGMLLAITEYYAAMARMPATPADAGLSAPEEYRGKSLKSAGLLPDGRIELVFDAQSGADGGRVLFVPDLAHVDTMGIQWHCETYDYPLIRRALPTCEYKAAAPSAVESAPNTPAKAD
ncbi:MAG: hypothetical protein J0H15_10405 [Xanthomonadales bacterium]|nr:hypothetical protein [Xanthomonadales bacterium]